MLIWRSTWIFDFNIITKCNVFLTNYSFAQNYANLHGLNSMICANIMLPIHTVYIVDCAWAVSTTQIGWSFDFTTNLLHDENCAIQLALPVCEHFERLKETNPKKSKPHLRNVFNDEIISELQARLILLIERINFAAKVQIYFIKFERKCFIFNMQLHFLRGFDNFSRWNFRNFESLRCLNIDNMVR